MRREVFKKAWSEFEKRLDWLTEPKEYSFLYYAVTGVILWLLEPLITKMLGDAGYYAFLLLILVGLFWHSGRVMKSESKQEEKSSSPEDGAPPS